MNDHNDSTAIPDVYVPPPEPEPLDYTPIQWWEWLIWLGLNCAIVTFWYYCWRT